MPHRRSLTYANFNPRSPRGERRAIVLTSLQYFHFNPRSPRGERLFRRPQLHYSPYFNPRSPRGERRGSSRLQGHQHYFNPRSPRGERRGRHRAPLSDARFQSTLPARGATAAAEDLCEVANISIHAPREGSDAPPCQIATGAAYFNPRSPRGERLMPSNDSDVRT